MKQVEVQVKQVKQVKQVVFRCALARWRLGLVVVVLLLALVRMFEEVRKVMMLQWQLDEVLVLLEVVLRGVKKVMMLEWELMKLLLRLQVKLSEGLKLEVSVLGWIDWVVRQWSGWIECEEVPFATSFDGLEGCMSAQDPPDRRRVRCRKSQGRGRCLEWRDLGQCCTTQPKTQLVPESEW